FNFSRCSNLLQDLLPKRRERQLDGQVGGLIALVDDGIYFHDFKTQHASVVGDDFHGKVRLAIGGGAVSSHAESFLHDGAHAAFVDIAHGEDLDSGLAYVFFFEVVNIADADEHAIFRTHFGRKVVDPAEFDGRKAHERGERHAVDIAAEGRVGSVHVGVGVDP